MRDPLAPYRGLRGRELAVAVALTPILIPIWALLATLKPIRLAYDEIMTRWWGGR